MTELERLAATILMQWRADGGENGGPMTVGALLDRVLPYRVARRMLGIDVSEDYEALVMRLLAEEEDLVRVDPEDAAEMARATMNSRLPDLDALQLLRSASLRFTAETVARLGDVLPMPGTKDESKWAAAVPVKLDGPPPRPASPPAPAPAATPTDDAESVPRSRPRGKRRAADVAEPATPVSAAPPEPTQRSADVIPLHPPSAPAPAPASKPSEPPPDFLTTVTFTPPAPVQCWSCAESLPADRAVKFCPFCGADQRQPACSACGAPADRGWKHCAECGAKL